MELKNLFAQLPVARLRELAKQHNLNTKIKSPSTMLKAEQVHALSSHFETLIGDQLMPKAGSPIKLKPTEIPREYQKLKEKEYRQDMPQDLQEWARQFVKVKPAPYDVAREKRKERSEAYTTNKKLEDAIKRREARTAKAKAKRIEKKGQPVVPKEEKEETEQTPGGEVVKKLNSYLKQAKKLETMEEGQAGKDLYATIDEKTTNIVKKAKKNAQITAKELQNIEKINKKIREILDNEDIADLFLF